MSSPAPAAPLPTRQQLDEIDALLRRMLTLPSLGGDAPPSSPTLPATEFSPPPAPVIREFKPSLPPAVGEPSVHSWRVEWPQAPSSQAAPPPSIAAWGTPVPSPIEPVPWAALPQQPAAPAYAAPVVETPGLQANPTPTIFPQTPAPLPSASTSIVVWLLMLLNGTFNILSYLLGPLGAWLRGPGRTFMGWAGLAMMAAALVWAVGDWYGYDWPRPDLSRFSVKR